MKAATVWSIGQIGHHTPEHAKVVAMANILPKLLDLYTDANSSEDLRAKVKAVTLSDEDMHSHSIIVPFICCHQLHAFLHAESEHTS